MASKLQEYRRMSEEAQRQLTGSLERWQSFLATASRLYKYPYHEQVMIHAQRPDATACAEFDVWNNTMRRYVRRGSKGIALIDTSGDRERLRYVFDVSDTGTRPNSRSLNLWELREEHIPAVSSMLEKNYGVPAGESLAVQLEAVASQLAREYWEDNRRDILGILEDSFLEEYDEFNVGVAFRNAAEVSISYSLLYRFIRARREFDGYEVVEFIDDGYSGTNGNRPSFERMIESLKNGEANVVICKDFSRFFRDYVEIGDYLERIFPFLGVRFIAVNDGYDSDDYKGSTAGMEVVMKYIVYSYYSRDLSQKIKTVMSTRKSKGEFVASQAPYGYMKDPNVKRKIIPNPDTAPVVRKIFDLALEGKTPAEIAVILNDYKLETPSAYFRRMNPDSKKFRTSSKEACWTVSNVREILKRREYTGVMVMNQRRWKGLDNPRTVWTDESEWQIIPDCHEAIVSESEYEEAQKVFRKIRKGYDRSPDQYLLRSLVHCGACGRTMQRQKHSQDRAYAPRGVSVMPTIRLPATYRSVLR